MNSESTVREVASTASPPTGPHHQFWSNLDSWLIVSGSRPRSPNHQEGAIMTKLVENAAGRLVPAEINGVEAVA